MYKANQQQITEWKNKYGEVFKITVDDKCCFLKKPDRKTLSAASSIAAKDPVAYNETILNNCWIAGDEEIKKEDAYFFGASSQLAELVEVKHASLEKL